MATTCTLDKIPDNDDFPQRRPGIKPNEAPRPLPTTTGVRLDATEEARARFGARTEEEIDRDWAEYHDWSGRVSRWIDRDEPGPQPY